MPEQEPSTPITIPLEKRNSQVSKTPQLHYPSTWTPGPPNLISSWHGPTPPPPKSKPPHLRALSASMGSLPTSSLKTPETPSRHTTRECPEEPLSLSVVTPTAFCLSCGQQDSQRSDPQSNDTDNDNGDAAFPVGSLNMSPVINREDETSESSETSNLPFINPSGSSIVEVDSTNFHFSGSQTGQISGRVTTLHEVLSSTDESQLSDPELGKIEEEEQQWPKSAQLLKNDAVPPDQKILDSVDPANDQDESASTAESRSDSADGGEQPERAEASQSSISEDCNSTCTSKRNIIYKLVCKDTTQNPQIETIRCSWQPFDGIISDEMEDKARQSLAVIDVIEVIEGFPLRKQQPRASQHRHNFGTAEGGDPGEYKAGTDFFARVVWPSNIRILSPHLLQVLRSLVLYYPLFDVQAKEMLVGSPFSIIFHY
jgi:hypothetical protein